MICSKCKAEIPKDSKFCLECGTKLDILKGESKPLKKELLALELDLKRKPDEETVIKIIESLMGRKDYNRLKDLEKDVISHLKVEMYVLKSDELSLVKDMVIKHGQTGRFSIDDVVVRKLGGGRKAAVLVTLLLVLGGAIVTEIVIPLLGEKLINEAPTAKITSPENLIVISTGQTVLLSAEASDKEDEHIPGSKFVWTSNQDGELGIGSSKSVSSLSPGVHTITLTVVDSKGAKGSESIVITIEDRELLYELKKTSTVNVAGTETSAYIRVWNPFLDASAPDKGWLELENPYYRIRVNLDHSYYLIYDKALKKDLLIFNDKVENKMDMLTGSDIGFADLDGNNQVPFSTTARDDVDGIRKYTVLYEDKNTGFILVSTEGWDFQVVDPGRGYDMEAEVMFGIFADMPYFIDATEINNLQAQGLARESEKKNPNEVIKSWVLQGGYDSASIKGGDTDHLNRQVYEPFYEVQSLGGERKPWHAGSTEISKMFPDHVLLGDRLGGAIVFSLPQGVFRWDDSQEVYGGQVVAEFIIMVEKPQKAVAFSVDPVSRESFLYDSKDYSTIPGYAESFGDICRKFSLSCVGTISPKEYEVKRFAYVISLTNDWYDGTSNKVKSDIWSDADVALEDFKRYENIIYQHFSSTKPLKG
jgi:hypothetical protein